MNPLWLVVPLLVLNYGAIGRVALALERIAWINQKYVEAEALDASADE